MDQEEKSLFRVHFKMRHDSEGMANQDFYIESECENSAVVAVLQYATAPIAFGSIHVDKLGNATIVS